MSTDHDISVLNRLTTTTLDGMSHTEPMPSGVGPDDHRPPATQGGD
jgi:hypothetical protein